MFMPLYIIVERVAIIIRFLVNASGVINPRLHTTFNLMEVQSIALVIISLMIIIMLKIR